MNCFNISIGTNSVIEGSRTMSVNVTLDCNMTVLVEVNITDSNVGKEIIACTISFTRDKGQRLTPEWIWLSVFENLVNYLGRTTLKISKGD